MVDGGDEGAGTNHDVVADGDRSDVEDGDIVVGEEVVSDMDVFPVVAVEDGVDPRVVADGAEEGADGFLDGSEVGEVGVVESTASFEGVFFVGADVGAPKVVFEACLKFLGFCHLMVVVSA